VSLYIVFKREAPVKLGSSIRLLDTCLLLFSLKPLFFSLFHYRDKDNNLNIERVHRVHMCEKGYMLCFCSRLYWSTHARIMLQISIASHDISSLIHWQHSCPCKRDLEDLIDGFPLVCVCAHIINQLLW